MPITDKEEYADNTSRQRTDHTLEITRLGATKLEPAAVVELDRLDRAMASEGEAR